MQLTDTYFVVGHFHMMIGGVTLMATFGGLHYWFPKMFGRMMNQTLGKAHFWLTFAPFFIIFFMQHFLGIQGAPRRYYAFTAYDFLKETRLQNLIISSCARLGACISWHLIDRAAFGAQDRVPSHIKEFHAAILALPLAAEFGFRHVWLIPDGLKRTAARPHSTRSPARSLALVSRAGPLCQTGT